MITLERCINISSHELYYQCVDFELQREIRKYLDEDQKFNKAMNGDNEYEDATHVKEVDGR